MIDYDEPIRVIWEPNPGSQELFLNAPVDELLIHGTRGSAKTDALIMDFAQDVGCGYGEAWRGILFRQTYKQLSDVIAKTKKWFYRIFPGAKFNESDSRWDFPDGETLLLRYMDKPIDYWNYHGHEYPWIGWEELTNWPTMECYEMMTACNRSSFKNIPKRIRATTNPWGAGHAAVKRYFIDIGPPGTVRVERKRIEALQLEIEKTRSHIFSTIFENKHLIENDPEYLVALMKIKDENLRKAWLEGSWDIVAGGFFSHAYNPSIHKIKNFIPPPHWDSFVSFDWGSAKPFSFGFFTISDGTALQDGRIYPRGSLIRFDEIYGQQKNDFNVGLRYSNAKIAKVLDDRMKQWEKQGVKFSDGVADPSIWTEQGGDSIYMQIKKEMRKINPARGLTKIFDPADNSRVAGWQQMLSRFEGDDNSENLPMIYACERCIDWHRVIPQLIRDEKNWDDIDTEQEDHNADETRYACMRRKRELIVGKLYGT